MVPKYFLLTSVLHLVFLTGTGQGSDSVYFTNGFKVGEVHEHSVVIWTRLCEQEKAVPVRHDRKEPPFRSPLLFKDSIWGEEQKDWFLETIRISDATEAEGRWQRSFLGEKDVFVINGDRHWQYVSQDTITGVYEFSQGPSGNSYARGWDPRDRRPEHQFLRVNGGFLVVEVYRKDDIPHITFPHRDVNGLIVNEKTLTLN